MPGSSSNESAAASGKTIAGLDFDARSIELARAQAAQAGVADRVRFHAAPVEALPAEPRWDLVTTFDVIHDLPDPAAALAHIRAGLADGGTYLMVEPKVADDLAANLGNPFARMFRAISCLHCVPQSLAQGGPGLGTCMGPAHIGELMREAGFTRVAPLDIRSNVLSFHAVRH